MTVTLFYKRGNLYFCYLNGLFPVCESCRFFFLPEHCDNVILQPRTGRHIDSSHILFAAVGGWLMRQSVGLRILECCVCIDGEILLGCSFELKKQ